MPAITVYPALVIGLGEGGKSICQAALRQIKESYSALTYTTHFIHGDSTGWRKLTTDDDVASLSTTTEVEGLDRRHWFDRFSTELYVEGFNTLLKTVEGDVLADRNWREARRQGYNIPRSIPFVEVYIALSLGEELGAGAFFPVLSIIRQIFSQRMQSTAVIALLDLSSTREESDREVGLQKLGVGLAELNAVIAGLIDVDKGEITLHPSPLPEGQRPLTSCVLADLCNADGFYLDSVSDVQAVLGQFLAAWLACNVRGTNEQSYEHFMGVRTILRPNEGAGVCRMVGVFSKVLPVRALSQYCALRLGDRVIGQEFLREGPPDEQSAQVAASTFIVDNELEEGRLLTALRDLKPLPPLGDYLDPTLFEEKHIPKGVLVDRLLSLDAFLGSTRVPRYLTKVKGNANEFLKAVSDRLDQAVDDLTCSKPMGFQAAKSFLRRLRIELEEMLVQPSERVMIAEIEPYANDLQEALDRCPNRPALMIKTGLFFTLLAYVLFSTDLVSQHYGHRIWISSLILVGLILVLGLAVFGTIWISEGRVQKAQGAFINEGLARKYNDIIRFTALKEQERIVTTLINQIGNYLEQGSPLCRLQRVLEEAKTTIHAGVKAAFYRPAGSFEEVLFEESDYEKMYEDHPADAARVAKDFIAQGGLAAWRTTEAETLAQSLVNLCRQEYEPRFTRLDVETELMRRYEPASAVADIHDELRLKSVPLLHYATGAYTQAETKQELLLTGDAETSMFADSLSDSSGLELLSTNNSHRLTYLSMIWDVALPDVDPWKEGHASLEWLDQKTLARLCLVKNWDQLPQL
jgi:hypothetical protein